MAPRFTFQRRIRTLTSEQFNVYDAESQSEGQNAIGQLDIHYLGDFTMEVALVLFEEREQQEIEELLAAIDDDILYSFGLEGRRANVVVFQGREAGFYEFHPGQPEGNYEEEEEEPEDQAEHDVI